MKDLMFNSWLGCAIRAAWWYDAQARFGLEWFFCFICVNKRNHVHYLSCEKGWLQIVGGFLLKLNSCCLAAKRSHMWKSSSIGSALCYRDVPSHTWPILHFNETSMMFVKCFLLVTTFHACHVIRRFVFLVKSIFSVQISYLDSFSYL